MKGNISVKTLAVCVVICYDTPVTIRENMQRTPRNYNGTARTTKELKTVLSGVLKNVRKKQSINPQQIVSAWPSIVGEKLAPMAQAEAFEEGVLFVKVSNSTLYSLLAQNEKGNLLKKLRAQFKNTEIKNIIFRRG